MTSSSLPSPEDTPQRSRRRWLLRALALCGVPWLPARAASYSVTIAAMHSAHENEMGVSYRYTEFGRRAQLDGYRGVAYLFTAFAASELVHASNFAKILARLNVEVAAVPKPTLQVGSTRENLIAAARGEIESIDSFYPKLLEQIRPESHPDAIATVRYAWASEQQHRDKIQQIQRWSPIFFEQVARIIDEKTGQYFVCQLCGSTLNAVPPGKCPVCGNPSSHYRRIDAPA
jgi:rubrerythrin